MFCSDCGNRLSQAARFCASCGARAEAPAAVSPPSTQSPRPHPAVLRSNADTFVAAGVPRDYPGSTFIQGWSTWIVVPLFIVYVLVVASVPRLDGFITLAAWGGLAAAVYQDLDRTRMSRWWVLAAFVCAFLGFGIYLYTRNTRGLRTYAAPLRAAA
jgi:cbb3-type cytochrome oxidase subunit 3